MLGFIIGTVCVIGLIKILRHNHWGPRGYGAPWAQRGYGCGYGSHGGGRHGFGGPRFWLRSIFERLETTPGQEKVIMSALDELRSNRTAVREEMRQTRADLARVVAGGLVDDAALEETFARHDRLLARLRVSFIEATKKITEALDERQRRQLAEMLEGRGWFGGGPRWGDPLPSVWA
jgi:Spy/CpxP family protein refolding chaperone